MCGINHKPYKRRYIFWDAESGKRLFGLIVISDSCKSFDERCKILEEVSSAGPTYNDQQKLRRFDVKLVFCVSHQDDMDNLKERVKVLEADLSAIEGIQDLEFIFCVSLQDVMHKLVERLKVLEADLSAIEEIQDLLFVFCVTLQVELDILKERVKVLEADLSAIEGKQDLEFVICVLLQDATHNLLRRIKVLEADLSAIEEIQDLFVFCVTLHVELDILKERVKVLEADLSAIEEIQDLEFVLYVRLANEMDNPLERVKVLNADLSATKEIQYLEFVFCVTLLDEMDNLIKERVKVMEAHYLSAIEVMSAIQKFEETLNRKWEHVNRESLLTLSKRNREHLSSEDSDIETLLNKDVLYRLKCDADVSSIKSEESEERFDVTMEECVIDSILESKVPLELESKDFIPKHEITTYLPEVSKKRGDFRRFSVCRYSLRETVETCVSVLKTPLVSLIHYTQHVLSTDFPDPVMEEPELKPRSAKHRLMLSFISYKERIFTANFLKHCFDPPLNRLRTSTRATKSFKTEVLLSLLLFFPLLCVSSACPATGHTTREQSVVGSCLLVSITAICAYDKSIKSTKKTQRFTPDCLQGQCHLAICTGTPTRPAIQIVIYTPCKLIEKKLSVKQCNKRCPGFGDEIQQTGETKPRTSAETSDKTANQLTPKLQLGYGLLRTHLAIPSKHNLVTNKTGKFLVRKESLILRGYRPSDLGNARQQPNATKPGASERTFDKTERQQENYFGRVIMMTLVLCGLLVLFTLLDPCAIQMKRSVKRSTPQDENSSTLRGRDTGVETMVELAIADTTQAALPIISQATSLDVDEKQPFKEEVDGVAVETQESTVENAFLSLIYKQPLRKNIFSIISLVMQFRDQIRKQYIRHNIEENIRSEVDNSGSSSLALGDGSLLVLHKRLLVPVEKNLNVDQDLKISRKKRGKSQLTLIVKENDKDITLPQTVSNNDVLKQKTQSELEQLANGFRSRVFSESNFQKATAHVTMASAVDTNFRDLKNKVSIKSPSASLMYFKKGHACGNKLEIVSNPLPKDDVTELLRDLTTLPQPCFNKFVIQQTRRDLLVYYMPEVEVTNIPYFESLMSVIDQISRGRPPAPHVSMRYEMLRFCTLRSYPKEDKPYLIKLAEAGFYYASDGDGVVCYCCGIRRYNWTAADRPVEVHKRINPTCKFLTKNLEVNVRNNYNGPFSSALVFIDSIPEPPESQEPPEDVNNESVPERNRTPAGRPQNASNSSQQLGINTAIPKHSQYATKTARIASYVGWPDTASHNPEELADAGFFYAGFGDCVRCFYCGIGLRHWTHDDNPWIEHARWAKNCVFVKQKKGEEFINLVQLAVQYSQDNAAQSNTSGNEIQAQELESYLLSDAAQSVLEMGYQPRMIKKAIEDILRGNRQARLSAETLMEMILRLEETEETYSETPVAPPPQPASALSHGSAEGAAASASTENKGNEKIGKSKAKTPESGKDKDKRSDRKPDSKKKDKKESDDTTAQDPRAIKAENEQLKEQTLCKVCLDQTVCIVFLPCGHLVTCADCAPAMRKCPICRALVKGTVRTYMS